MDKPTGHIGPVTIRKAIICGLLLVFIILFEYVGFLEGINNYFYDLSFRTRGFRAPSKDIIIVTIDDKTLEKLGRWPIKRSYYTSLIDKTAGAKAVAFDIIMTEPTDDDAFLARAIKEHGNIILPVFIENNENVKYPVALLSASPVGHVHVEQGIDGIVREVYHTLQLRNDLLHSLSSVAYGFATNKPFFRTFDKKKYIPDSKITQSNPMYINYCGGPGSFESVSLIDVLNNVYPPPFFNNRIVLVGVSAAGAGDRILTPFSQERRSMPGIEGQANTLNTMLMNNAIDIILPWVRWLIAVFLAMVSFICFLRSTEQRATILGLIMLLSIGVITYLLFSAFNVWLAPAIYFFTVFFVFILAYVFKFNDAITTLDKAYMTVVPHLRWGYAGDNEKHVERGIFGSLTEKGIQSKAQILNDVSRQLGFEKELTDRALLSDIHGVLIFGPDRKNILINNLAQTLFKENGVEAGSADIFVTSLAPAVMENIEPEDVPGRLYNEKEDVSFTISLEKPAKKFFKVDASSFAVNERTYLLIMLSDVTKIKELEILKGHIISVVSHELKTPMTSIQGFSEILAGNLEGKMKSFAGIIHRESERLVRFLNTFLDITRIEEGRQPIKMTSINLNDVIREVASALKPIGDTNGITIHTDIPDNTDDIVIDRDLTKQCIFNLVENAIKYSPSGKEVMIKLTSETDHLKIDIIDHGYGIKEDDLNKVFEKFYRSSSDKTKNIKGSGLGLTFVKEAVEAQGGKMTLASVCGEGSSFSIVFQKTT
ncbi:MAG: CHASE2 domain-containing protein [Proteobacteria bacterium]|nr:CHASE2 domain-containing protein [Pseudomonadota bacterium]